MERRHGGGERRKKKREGALSPGSEDTEPTDVEHLLGIAMGCMGMSRNDFCRCTPSEFYEAYGAWNEMQAQRERGAWERMRMQCLCSLQPYSKNKLSVQDIMRFPWETSGSEEGRGKSEESLGHEEVMARYREAKRKAGLR